MGYWDTGTRGIRGGRTSSHALCALRNLMMQCSVKLSDSVHYSPCVPFVQFSRVVPHMPFPG